MKSLKIPAFLHEVFGEKQKVWMIVTILFFGGALTTALYIRYPYLYKDIALWRSVLASIFIFDIFCGCLANFTPSTSNYYAARSTKRVIFIAVHIHILLIAVLLETNLWNSLWIWLYTLIGAGIVNAIRGKHQLFIGGLLLSAGLGWFPMLPAIESYMLIISSLFMLKVLYSFSVNHYGNRSE